MGDNEAWSPGGQVASPRRSLSPMRQEESDSRRDYDERDSRREYGDRARYDRHEREDRRDDRRDDRRGPPPARGGGRDGGSGGNGNEPNPGNNLHVSGVSKLLDDRQLEDAFAKYGKVVKTQIMYDPHSRESRGFAFVTFETSEEADAAIAGLNGEELSGRTLTVQKARRSRARSPTPGRYQGPPKARGGPRGGDRYGPPGGPDRWGPPPPRGYYPPPRDFDGWGPPPPDRYGPPPRGYDRYAYPPPPPPRDYLPPRGGYREYSPPPTMRRPAYDDYARPPGYDDMPPPRQ